MTYEFRFYINNKIQFRGILKSYRCFAMNENGKKCRRMTCMGTKFCYSHLLYYKNLCIMKSTIPKAGKGLFCIVANTDERLLVFRKNQFIIDYDGEIIKFDELLERYGNTHTAPYGVVIDEKRGIYEDGALRRGIGCFCNHSTGENVNARLVVALNHIVVVATKPIYNGDEIIINYGNLYELNEKNVKYETVRIS